MVPVAERATKILKGSLVPGDLRSKLVHYALEIDHMPYFEMMKVLASSVDESRMLLEGIFTKLQPALLNEAITLPLEYSILY